MNTDTPMEIPLAQNTTQITPLPSWRRHIQHFTDYLNGAIDPIDYIHHATEFHTAFGRHVDSVSESLLGTNVPMQFEDAPGEGAAAAAPAERGNSPHGEEDIVRDIGLALRNYYDNLPPTITPHYPQPSAVEDLSLGMLWHVISHWSNNQVGDRVTLKFDSGDAIIDGPERPQNIRYRLAPLETLHNTIFDLGSLFLQEEDEKRLYDEFLDEPSRGKLFFDYARETYRFRRPTERFLQRYNAQRHAERQIEQRANGAYFIQDDGSEISEREFENKQNEAKVRRLERTVIRLFSDEEEAAHAVASISGLPTPGTRQ